jgi:hypothetical protein
MFKKKSVVMKMVNDDKLNLEPTEPIDYSQIAQEVVKSVATVVVIYIAADTIRQASLHVLRALI